MAILTSRGWPALLAATLFIAAQATQAQPVNGCPAGQAMQASDPSGRNVTCVPIPDAAALQAQVAAEAASRAGMDATLLQAIGDEAAARKSADDELRSSISETSIVGRYSFTGPLVCLVSTNGFNDDLTPKAPVFGGPATVVQQFMGTSSGIRTFNADGTGTMQITTQTLNFPIVFYSFPSTVGLGFGGTPPQPGGGASVAVQTGSFAWQIVDGKLIIDDLTSIGTITKGGSRVGWTLQNLNLPKSVGILGRDVKTITVSHDDAQVETGVQTSPDGATVVRSDRICTRQRVLTKL